MELWTLEGASINGALQKFVPFLGPKQWHDSFDQIFTSSKAKYDITWKQNSQLLTWQVVISE